MSWRKTHRSWDPHTFGFINWRRCHPLRMRKMGEGDVYGEKACVLILDTLMYRHLCWFLDCWEPKTVHVYSCSWAQSLSVCPWCIHVHACTYMYTHVCGCLLGFMGDMFVCTGMRSCVCLCMYSLEFICICTCSHVFMYVSMCACMYLWVHMCVYICMCTGVLLGLLICCPELDEALLWGCLVFCRVSRASLSSIN